MTSPSEFLFDCKYENSQCRGTVAVIARDSQYLPVLWDDDIGTVDEHRENFAELEAAITAAREWAGELN